MSDLRSEVLDVLYDICDSLTGGQEVRIVGEAMNRLSKLGKLNAQRREAAVVEAVLDALNHEEDSIGHLIEDAEPMPSVIYVGASNLEALEWNDIERVLDTECPDALASFNARFSAAERERPDQDDVPRYDEKGKVIKENKEYDPEARSYQDSSVNPKIPEDGKVIIGLTDRPLRPGNAADAAMDVFPPRRRRDFT